jgi:hypothetical protein
MASITKICNTVETTGTWITCTQAYLAANDAQRARSASTIYDIFTVSDFTFGLPAGATIDGIEVVIDLGTNNASGVGKAKSALSWDDGGSWTADSAEVSQSGGSDDIKIMGAPTDKWGRSWAILDFADGTFQVKIYGKINSASYNVRIDLLQVIVYYTPVSGPSGVKTINGLAIASVKTINDLVIGSVKTINNAS